MTSLLGIVYFPTELFSYVYLAFSCFIYVGICYWPFILIFYWLKYILKEIQARMCHININVQYIFGVDQLLMLNLPKPGYVAPRMKSLLQKLYDYHNERLHGHEDISFPFQLDVYFPLSPKRLLLNLPIKTRSCWSFTSTCILSWFTGGIVLLLCFLFYLISLCSMSLHCPFMIPLSLAFSFSSIYLH